MRYLSRMRSSAGQLVLIATLTLVAGALLTGAPRVANGLEDQALRARVEGLPYQIKDLTFRYDGRPDDAFGPQHAQTRLKHQQTALGALLSSHIRQSWYGVTIDHNGTDVRDTGLDGRAAFGFRSGSGLPEAVTLVSGRWPANANSDIAVEVALPKVSATIMGMTVGSEFTITRPELENVPVRVVGIIEPRDATDPMWEPEPLALKAYAPMDDGEAYLSLLLTDIPGMTKVSARGYPIRYEWRYRVDPATLDMAKLSTLIPAILDGRKRGMNGSTSETGLDTALARFADNAQAARSLFAVIQAATLATLTGLVLLAARLAILRRRREFILLRARGAALHRIAARTLAELLPAVALAALAGWVLGTLAPGRAAETGSLVVLFAAVAALSAPVMALFSLSRFTDEREDFTTARAGIKRRTVELALVAVAVLGLWLLRRRGLTAEFDIYLVTVPVLVAAAAAILMLRTVPTPLALASRIAARGRGTVGFLGLARAGRAAPATVGPIAVLVVAVCTTVFSVGVAGTVSSGRDRAADQDIPADALVQGFYFTPDTADDLRRLPGVTGVAPLSGMAAQELIASREVGAQRLGQAYVLVIDGGAFAEVAAKAGRQIGGYEAVVHATAGQRYTPALVSPEVARGLGDHTTALLNLQGAAYDIGVAGVVPSFPSLPRSADRFVILPWQALHVPPDNPLNPTGFLVSGEIDPDALSAAGDAGQLRWLSLTTEPKPGYDPLTEVRTWDDRRAQLELTGVNSVLSFSYGMGALAGIVLALLAVGFAVLAGAQARGRVLSRLRTMGLSRGQGRRLLMIELAPMVTAAVLAGGAVGLGLPWLVGPALSLASFTDGYEGGLWLDPMLISGALALILVGLATAVVVETLFNRRLRLGEVLRLGSTEQE